MNNKQRLSIEKLILTQPVEVVLVDNTALISGGVGSEDNCA